MSHTLMIIFTLSVCVLRPHPLPAAIQLFLENPTSQQVVSGISLVSGWAYSTRANTPLQVRLRIDGQPTDISIPCCVARGDVAAAFPGIAPLATGFGAAVNYGELSTGVHTVGVEITAPGETPLLVDHTVTVVKPGATNFVPALDLRAATAAIDGGEVIIADARVRNGNSTVRTNLRLQYTPSLQSFTLNTAFNADANLFGQVQAVFSNCTFSGGCHGSDNPQAGLRLSSGAAFANLVAVRSTELPGVFRVNPGKPDESYLLQKIERTNPPIGGQMPLGGPPLPRNQIEVIRQWIAAGAPPP